MYEAIIYYNSQFCKQRWPDSSYIILKKKSWCDDNSLNRDCGLGTTLSEILGSFAKKKIFLTGFF